MTTVKVKEGNYADELSVVVIVTEEVQTTVTTNIEISEDLVLKTIASLEEKKQEYSNQVDAEILTNRELLVKIRSVDRSKSVVL